MRFWCLQSLLLLQSLLALHATSIDDDAEDDILSSIAYNNESEAQKCNSEQQSLLQSAGARVSKTASTLKAQDPSKMPENDDDWKYIFGHPNASLLQYDNSQGWEKGKYVGIKGWVHTHNFYRCLHGMQPMKWDIDMAKKADWWCTTGGMGHSDNLEITPIGSENIAFGSSMDQHEAVRVWWNEYNDAWLPEEYGGSWQDNMHGMLHFLAFTWRNADIMGCAYTKSPGGKFVCEYGNSECRTRKIQKDKSGPVRCKKRLLVPNYGPQKCPGDESANDCISRKVKTEAECSAKTDKVEVAPEDGGFERDGKPAGYGYSMPDADQYPPGSGSGAPPPPSSNPAPAPKPSPKPSPKPGSGKPSPSPPSPGADSDCEPGAKGPAGPPGPPGYDGKEGPPGPPR